MIQLHSTTKMDSLKELYPPQQNPRNMVSLKHLNFVGSKSSASPCQMMNQKFYVVSYFIFQSSNPSYAYSYIWIKFQMGYPHQYRKHQRKQLIMKLEIGITHVQIKMHRKRKKAFKFQEHTGIHDEVIRLSPQINITHSSHQKSNNRVLHQINILKFVKHLSLFSYKGNR